MSERLNSCFIHDVKQRPGYNDLPDMRLIRVSKLKEILAQLSDDAWISCNGTTGNLNVGEGEPQAAVFAYADWNDLTTLHQVGCIEIHLEEYTPFDRG